MDLGSIKKRMENNCYKSISDFAADVRLTFDNAVTYNGDGSDVCKVAREMKLTFEKLYQVMIATIEAEEKQRKLATYASYAVAKNFFLSLQFTTATGPVMDSVFDATHIIIQGVEISIIGVNSASTSCVTNSLLNLPIVHCGRRT